MLQGDGFRDVVGAKGAKACGSLLVSDPSGCLHAAGCFFAEELGRVRHWFSTLQRASALCRLTNILSMAFPVESGQIKFGHQGSKPVSTGSRNRRMTPRPYDWASPGAIRQPPRR